MTYREELSRLRAQRMEQQRGEILDDMIRIESDLGGAQQRAEQALARGDQYAAEWEVDAIERLENEIVERHAQLDAYDRQSAPQLSEAKQRWISRRQDLASQPGMDQVAGYAHNYITGHMGVADDSAEYFELMGHAIEPAEYQPMPTPDDICEALGLDPDEYNKNVEKLHRLKSLGEYPDR